MLTWQKNACIMQQKKKEKKKGTTDEWSKVKTVFELRDKVRRHSEA